MFVLNSGLASQPKKGTSQIFLNDFEIINCLKLPNNSGLENDTSATTSDYGHDR